MSENDKNKRILLWMVTGETGTSSMTMAIVALGLRDVDMRDVPLRGYDWNAPRDPSDFQRCYLLLQAVPEIREDFDAIAAACPPFAPILAEWDALCEIYERDQPLGKWKQFYARIQALRGGA